MTPTASHFDHAPQVARGAAGARCGNASDNTDDDRNLAQRHRFGADRDIPVDPQYQEAFKLRRVGVAMAVIAVVVGVANWVLR